MSRNRVCVVVCGLLALLAADAFSPVALQRQVVRSRVSGPVAVSSPLETHSALWAATNGGGSVGPVKSMKKVIVVIRNKIVALYAAIISFFMEKAGATKKGVTTLFDKSSSMAASAGKTVTIAPRKAVSSVASNRDKALDLARKYAAEKLKEIDASIKKTSATEEVPAVETETPLTISPDTLKTLEAEPYHDQSNIPMQTYTAKEPFVGKVVSMKRIVGAAATGETCDVVIDHQGKMPYWEGQSYGVVPPGINPKNDKPYTNRLYSIASSRYGDDMKGTTTTLCVRRATYCCPELKADDPAKKGVCSNFLCDAKPGDSISLTGPSGKVMLMPESKPETDIIMVATGTGIAPYRSFWKRLFIENTPAAAAYKGQAWLFLGVANSDALLYDDELQMIKMKNPEQFRLDYALSREQTNKSGGTMYIQDKVEEYSEEIFAKMDAGAHMYFCGLKGMMPGILTMLEGVATSKGLVWKDKLKEWKIAGQWHVEVY